MAGIHALVSKSAAWTLIARIESAVAQKSNETIP
jgi:hypothetical protein